MLASERSATNALRKTKDSRGSQCVTLSFAALLLRVLVHGVTHSRRERGVALDPNELHHLPLLVVSVLAQVSAQRGQLAQVLFPFGV